MLPHTVVHTAAVRAKSHDSKKANFLGDEKTTRFNVNENHVTIVGTTSS